MCLYVFLVVCSYVFGTITIIGHAVGSQTLRDLQGAVYVDNLTEISFCFFFFMYFLRAL